MVHAVVNVHLHTYKLVNDCFLSIRPVEKLWGKLPHYDLLILSGTRQGVGGFACRIESTLNRLWNWINLLISPMENTFPWMKTRLKRYPPSCRVNKQGRTFLKGTNHWIFVFFLSYVYFFGNDIFSEWWSKYFRGATNHFFHCPTMVGRLFK